MGKSVAVGSLKSDVREGENGYPTGLFYHFFTFDQANLIRRYSFGGHEAWE